MQVAKALDEPVHLRRFVRAFTAHTYRVVIKIKAQTRPKGYKTFLMLNSTDFEIYPAHKC